jgi:tetratricopeptide (TPR) repeat protein
MKFLQWIGAKLSPQDKKVESAADVYQLLQKAQAHLELEEYDQARGPLLRAIEFRGRLNDAAAIDYILSALDATWSFTEKYENGIAFFSEYIGRYPKDSEAYVGRAGNLWYTGQLQEAIRDYSSALELKPNDIGSLSGRGQLLAEVGENGKAMEDLNLALLSLKTVSTADSAWVKWYEQIEAFVRNGRGFALAGLGEIGPAMDEFETSVNLSPENAWVYHNRAQVHDRAGSRKLAGSDYQKALTVQKPSLSPIRKKHAQARVRELSNRS